MTELTPQQRGYKLEDLFCDLLELHEMDYKRPYKTRDGEQIDGHFRYEKFDYLFERGTQYKQYNLLPGSHNDFRVASNGIDLHRR